MKRIIISLLLISISLSLFSQNEANNWFFGDGAGLDFSSGNPVSINGGRLNTEEGCATISNSSGQLLFYTNGENVYTSTHDPMQNGTGLHGNQSSSQSAIIVPRPLSTTEYYIFTVDEHNTNSWGLQHSLVDMDANGGMGEVVLAGKNTGLLDHATEKITAVKSDNCDSIWVIAFSSINGVSRTYNTFHSFEVTSTGVNPSITSTFSTNITDGRGYLKVSADGTKLAIAHSGLDGTGVKLYDFDPSSGVVSNENTLVLSDVSHLNNNSNTSPYGLEFSLDASKLYITSYEDYGTFDSTPNDGFLWQVDLTSAVLSPMLISFNPNNTYRGAIQMGPDGKIYKAQSDHYWQGANFLGVINNPNDLGLACNYVHNAVPINFGLSRQGLPPFIQSLFIADLPIVVDAGTVLDINLDLCDGETFILEPDTSAFPVGTTYAWTKDSNPLSLTVPSLTVDNATTFDTGHYRLSVDFNDGSCPLVGEAIVTFYDNPVINTPITIKQCDDDSDGISELDLTNYEYLIITDPMLNETLQYYPTFNDAQNQIVANEILNFMNFITSNRTIYVRVQNVNGCFTIGQINIEVTASSTSYAKSFYECDDLLDVDGNDTVNNDNTDGISGFDFSSVTNEVINLFPTVQQPNLDVAYYTTIIDGLLEQNPITNFNDFRNNLSPNYQKIYIKVTNSQNANCVGFGENMIVELFVEEIPVANAIPPLRVCATDINGTYPVNTSSLENDVLQGQTNVALTYFNEDGSQILPTLPNPFVTSTQTITVVVTKTNSLDPDGACSAEVLVDLIVDAQPFIAQTPTFDAACDDGIDDTDLMANFDTSLVEYHLKGGNNVQTEMTYNYYNEDGSQIFNEDGLASPLPDPFYTQTQTITVEMYNPANNTCTDSTMIDFVVNPLPSFDVEGELLCLNYLPNPLTIDIFNALDTYQYFWFDKDNNDITVDSNQAFYNFTKGGEYTVKAVNSFNCERTKMVTVEESEIPILEDVQVYDNQESNRIAVIVSGISKYEFAIGNQSFEIGNTGNGHLFLDVEEGLHVIRVRDLLGCGEISYEVPVIRFPKFFSPNGDGINENWQVKASDAFPIISLTVFDRHGKIMSQFTDKEDGWDGKYLGKDAHKSDYWYLAIIIDRFGKQIERKGHFSLR